MPEHEGYLGITNLLLEARKLMEDGEAKDLVTKALREVIRQAKQSVTSFEIGMDLGGIMSKDWDEQK